MKFMKLGSKPDSFQTDGTNVRNAVSELATDITVIVGNVKFYLHKFPLLSKSAHLQKLVTAPTGDHNDEINITEIPGGSAAFEICAKFCYGMTVTLNAHNVVAARCAAEYLGMHESIEKGNLTYKIDVFLTSSIFRSWKDSIIVLQSTKALIPISEDLQLVSSCLESIAVKASSDVAKVDWSYTYNRKKLPEENGNNANWNGVRNRVVPKDWWVEDLCELEIDLYKRVIASIERKGMVPNDVVGEALKAYAYGNLPGFRKGVLQCGDLLKYQSAVVTIVRLLPAEKGSASSSFLSKLLKASIVLASGDEIKEELVRRMGQQLEDASVSNILLPAPEGEATAYDVDAVQKMVEVFLQQDHNTKIESFEDGNQLQEPRGPGILSDATKLMVAKLIDGYLAEIAKDPNLPSVKFINLAEMVSGITRPSHDELYRGIDMYLKEHKGICKSDRKRICKLIDCKKLSSEVCIHAVQNERLPLRMVVQVLFFEQVRASTSSGSSTPDLPKGIKDLTSGSNGSSRSATTPEEDWDAVAMAEELKALKGELASLRLTNGGGGGGGSERNGDGKNGIDKAALTKMKGLLKSKKLFTKLWSSKGGFGENSGSDSSEGLGSANQEEAKSTPSRNKRHSVS